MLSSCIETEQLLTSPRPGMTAAGPAEKTQVLFLASATGLWLDVSENCLEVFGLHRSSLLGDGIFRLISNHPEYERQCWLDGLKSKGKFDRQVVDHKGRTNPAAVLRVSWVATQEVDVPTVIGAVSLVNLRGRAHQRLLAGRINSDKESASRLDDRAQGQLSLFHAVLSHEIHGPLTAIGLSAQLLSEAAVGNNIKNAGKHASRIEQAVERVRRVLTDVGVLIKTSQHESFPEERLDLNEWLQRAIREKADHEDGNHRLIAKVPPFSVIVQTHASLLHLALWNLIGNALKYSSGTQPVIISLSAEKDEAVISVQDFGVGIPLDDQNRLFEPFQRCANTGEIEGTGLGLLIALAAAEKANAGIRFISQEGLGSTFSLIVPLHCGSET